MKGGGDPCASYVDPRLDTAFRNLVSLAFIEIFSLFNSSPFNLFYSVALLWKYNLVDKCIQTLFNNLKM